MNFLEQKLIEHAVDKPQKTAIQSEGVSLDYLSLLIEIGNICSKLDFPASSSVDNNEEKKRRSFAFILANHPAWAVLDLALLFKNQCAVPLPVFFQLNN